MARKLSYEEKTPEEKAYDALKTKFRKDGFKANKRNMVLMDIACRKCGYLGYLYNITYVNGSLKRVITACTHCGYESEPEQVEQMGLI